jgi:hypothetical protein
MNRDEILQIAAEAGAFWELSETPEKDLAFLMRVVERVAVYERQRMEIDSIHTCHAECQRPSCVAMREAVKAEREACAEMVEGMNVQHPKHIAAAIRARGEK